MRIHLLQHNMTKLISKTDSLRSAQQHSTRQVQTSERVYWYTGNMLGYCKLIICFPFVFPLWRPYSLHFTSSC